MAAREALRRPTGDDLVAEADYLCRRLHVATGRVRAATADCGDEGRAVLVAGLAGLVAAAERLLGGGR